MDSFTTYDSKDHLIVALLEYLSDRFAVLIEATADGPLSDRLDTLIEWLAVGPSFDGVDGDAYHLVIFELRAQAPHNEALRSKLQENFSFLKGQCWGQRNYSRIPAPRLPDEELVAQLTSE